MKTSRLITFFAAMVAVSAMTVVASYVRADEYGPDYDTFAEVIRSAQEECRGAVDCEVSKLRTEVIFGESSDDQAKVKLSDEQVARLQEISTNQAQIWADTILEGDYEAAGETSLDQVEAVYRGEELVAYRISYAENAWFLGSCEYDHEDRSLLSECDQGRIVEASFVSPNMLSWMRDDFAYAEFMD